MRLISEYAPVQRLYLCFVHDFFNTRFGYGAAICNLINAAKQHVDVELFVGLDDLPHLQAECSRHDTVLSDVHLNHDAPNRSILAEFMPIFATDDTDQLIGLVFTHPVLSEATELKLFAERTMKRAAVSTQDLGLEFTTVQMLVNEELVLVCDWLFADDSGGAKFQSLSNRFPGHVLRRVPPLAGDVTHDLDFYLWPIAPRVWIVSEYPANTPQANSVQASLNVLSDHGHAVVRVPGLDPIVYGDVNTVPNYTNGLILNDVAIAPAYGRDEDAVVVRVLRDHGLGVVTVDCRQIILSNSAIHCISKTLPSRPHAA